MCLPRRRTPKFPLPISFPTLKFGPTISTSEPLVPAVLFCDECIAQILVSKEGMEGGGYSGDDGGKFAKCNNCETEAAAAWSYTRFNDAAAMSSVAATRELVNSLPERNSSNATAAQEPDFVCYKQQSDWLDET